MLSGIQEINIKQYHLTCLEKEQEKLKKLINNDFFKFAQANNIRKSFLKDILLFTDGVLNKVFPQKTKKNANFNHKYSYYDYDKQYLIKKSNNEYFFNWITKRIQKYNVEQKQLFNLIFPDLGKKLFNEDFDEINYDKINNEILKLSIEINEVKNEINNTYSKQLDIKNYLNNFSSIKKRRFSLILGPTNSGKTYQAIKRLTDSSSGLYLAPLRLLALEIYQKLKQNGINCNLITGEEKIIEKDAKFTSSTIEMCDFQNYFDTVIIDESQLLNDRERGFAWTNAISGVNANQIICLGTTEIQKSLENLIKDCNKNSVINEIIITQRMNKLEVTDNNEIQKGTAIITFSRKNVLYFAEYYKNRGYSVSVIYGALSPEVRRSQINRFINGDSDIIIATDAIGMGVNLPIQKILFSSIEKYDGIKTRELTHHEIKQIAGRAGRFNLTQNETGLVSLTNDVHNIKNLKLLEKNLLLNKDFSTDIYISPNFNYINQLSVLSKDKNIYNLLMIFSKMKTEKQNWQISDLKNQLNIALIIESEFCNLSLKDKFEICFSPIDDLNLIKDFSSIIYKKEEIDYKDYINIKPFSIKTLEGIENLIKIIGYWRWFNNKYDTFFKINDLNEFKEYKEELNKILDQKLIFKAKTKIKNSTK